jgi:predicted O-methyltransferase YrrM
VHALDAKVSAACARIRSALAGHARDGGLAPELGGVIRALAASKPAGTILCRGEDVGEIGAWILDGMDPASGLVALVQEPHEEAVLVRELGRDLRVSVHRQDAESFLTDVHAHRFDLIVDRDADDHPAVLRLGLGLLRAGGLYLAPHRLRDSLAELLAREPAESPGHAPGLEPTEWTFASLGGAQDTLIITRRSAPPVESRRRRR